MPAKERRRLKNKAIALRQAAINSFGVWNTMLYEVKKVMTITRETKEEAIQKAEIEMSRLWEMLSDERKCLWPGAAKRLGYLHTKPFMRVTKTIHNEDIKWIAKISYSQYELKPGFSKEEYQKAIDAYDKAEAECLIFQDECRELGLDL